MNRATLERLRRAAPSLADAGDEEWRYLVQFAGMITRGVARARVRAWADEHAQQLRARGTAHHLDLARDMERAVAHVTDDAGTDAAFRAVAAARYTLGQGRPG